MIYTEDYYSTNNYHNYIERKDRYVKTAKDIEELLTSLSLIKKDSVFLDYGCAFGFLMEGFKELGYKNIYGFEISEYAKQIGQSRGNQYVDKIESSYDITFILDVMEHMTDDQIHMLFLSLDTKIIIGRIPCAEDGEEDFYLELSKQDKGHINCKDKKDWNILLNRYNFKTIFHLNLSSIYDSVGVYSFMAIRS